MQKFYLFAVILLTVGILPASVASERPEHFEGKSAETLEQAVANFSEANEVLAVLLSEDKLDARQLHEVHKLTYTMENALERIREDLGGLAETLEEVHVASESADPGTVRNKGREYLITARKLVK